MIKSGEIIATSDSAILLKCRTFIDIPQNLTGVTKAKIIKL